ncbi:MAG: DUF262 domain-containing protein [Acidimicrobiia bacterium]
MKCQTLTPFQIFGNQVRYVVPLFQRPYVWSREQQWEPLWDDIRTVADRILDGQGSAGSPDPPAPHFLGAIVLDQQLVPASYIDERHIVDGQQRLTTLQILLDGAQWIAQQHGNQNDASALQTLVLNNAAIASSPNDVFKVWPSNYDQAAFRSVMDDDLKTTAEPEGSRIAEAHTYFCREISEWIEPLGDPDKCRQRLHALTLALTQYLRLVVIDLEPGDNAQVIFETLNHRGAPLLAADLVKNLLFQAAAMAHDDVEALYNDHWKWFDTEQWRREVRQGRLRRPRIDVFLNYWLVEKSRREVPSDRVFADFRDFVATGNSDASDLMSELAESAGVYDQLEHQEWTSAEGTFYYRVLAVQEAFVWGPLLLWLFGQPNSRISVEQRWVALGAIESWLTRRMICRLTTKGYNNLVLDLINSLHGQQPPLVGDFIVEFLTEQTADARVWPDDAAIVEAVLGQPLYTAITRARLRMILEAIEDHYRTPKTEEQHCPRGALTIEHLLPQGWREHWPLPADDEPEEVLAVRRDRALHTLGNLSLVTSKLNPSMSNRPWTNDAAAARGLPPKGKYAYINESSVLLMNKKILEGWPSAWDEDAIATRGKRLASAVVEVWPRGEPATN